ncbi:hypothetical protein ACWD62_40290 [Streptomyces sp. NPDC005146]
MDAIDLLKRYLDQPIAEEGTYFDETERIPLSGVVSEEWRKAVVDDKGRMERGAAAVRSFRASADVGRAGRDEERVHRRTGPRNRAPCPVPRPVIMPLVLSEMAGLIWVRPVGEDALTGSRSRRTSPRRRGGADGGANRCGGEAGQAQEVVDDRLADAGNGAVPPVSPASRTTPRPHSGASAPAPALWTS